MIISEIKDSYLIDLKEYENLLKKIGILELDYARIRRWIESGRMSGIYEVKGIRGVYVDKNLYNSLIISINCDKCVYKDRLNIIGGIVNKGV